MSDDKGNGDLGQGRRRPIHLAATYTVIAEEPVITGADMGFYTYLRFHTANLAIQDEICRQMMAGLEQHRQTIAKLQVAALLMASQPKPGGPR